MIICDGEAGHHGDRTPQPSRSSSSTSASNPKISSTAYSPAQSPTLRSGARAVSRLALSVSTISLCVR
ncbi:hypothetical protein OG978_36515 [Streptomyces sp. NBC_01591]|uniref:hypothetical protein n=1 Tax=Streptomyces sp. NBC_01591 TaxID=2975888 RepID=UPI002DD9967F|nr:hypothetical protein [Streptomyces sp. NBC_01591]WSD72424.1 hypothetical protein OG978_36515 [Streptomyces sp. NBC_01591]